MSAHTLNALSHRFWTLAVATFLVAACSSSTPSPSPGPTPSAAPLFPVPSLPADASAWDRLMARVGAAGQPDRQAALDAFAIAFSPLPGTQAPAGADQVDLPDGTLAVEWILQFWDTLTAEQQAYVEPVITGGAPQAARGGQPIAAVGYFPPPAGPVRPAAPADWQALAEQMRTVIASKLGRELEAQLIVKPLASPSDVPANLAKNPGWAISLDANGKFVGKSTTCTIFINPLSLSFGPDDALDLMAHEVFHCFDRDLGALSDHWHEPPWVTEGAAMWAGVNLSAGKAHNAFTWWHQWLLDAGRPLYSRSYDAFPIYYLLQDVGVDTWANIDDVLQAARGGTEPAYEVLSGIGGEPFLDTWGSRYFMYDKTNWRYIGDGIGPPVMYFHVPEVPITAGDTYSQSADPYAAGDVLARFESDVVVLDSDGGHGQVGTRWNDMSLEDAVTRPFCTRPEGCTCPEGSVGSNTQFWDVPFDSPMSIGITGHVTGVRITLLGLNLDDLCQRPPTGGGGSSNTVCEHGCPTSNGDPHLTTLDGQTYDFQAAGEFTLLRSADGSFEIQARQEPWTDSHWVSINTAVAVGMGEDRVALYLSGRVRLLVNGQEVDQTADTLAGGLDVKPVQDGFEIDASDGTVVWFLGVGRWGVNVVVAPSDALRSSGVGLMGPVGAGSLPALPDGSAVTVGDDLHAATYDVLAPAWAVTAENSLFDYDAGQGPQTFRDPSIPSPDGPLTLTSLPLDQQQTGLTACASVDNQAFREQCAFDVAVTGDAGFLANYQSTDSVTTKGLVPIPTNGPEVTPEPLPGGDACGVLTDEQILQITGYAVASKTPGVSEDGSWTAGCYWTLDARSSTYGFWELYLNVQTPGGRAAFDDYLVTWPNLEHVPNLGDDAVLNVGNSVMAVKGDTLVDVQYVQFKDVAAAALDLIELARAVLGH